MAFQSVPNVIKAAALFLRDGKQIVNTFYWELESGYGAGDVDAIAVALDNLIATTWLPILPTAITYVAVETIGLENLNDFTGFADAGSGVGAISDTEYASPQVTIAVKRASNVSGRSARGRIYWPGFASNQLSGASNVFVTTAVGANIVAAVDAVRTLAVVNDPDPVIVSRYQDNAPRPVGVTFPWLTTSLTDLRVDTQRGRLRGLQE